MLDLPGPEESTSAWSFNKKDYHIITGKTWNVYWRLKNSLNRFKEHALLFQRSRVQCSAATLGCSQPPVILASEGPLYICHTHTTIINAIGFKKPKCATHENTIYFTFLTHKRNQSQSSWKVVYIQPVCSAKNIASSVPRNGEQIKLQ